MSRLDQKYVFSSVDQQIDDTLQDKNKTKDQANSRILPMYSILSKRKGARKYNSQVIWGGKYLRGLFEYFSGTTRRIMTLAGTDLFYDNNNGVFAKAGLTLNDASNYLLSGVSYKGFAYLANNRNVLITYNGSVFGNAGVAVPSVAGVTFSKVQGTLPIGTYSYKVTYVYDSYQQSDGSAATSTTTTALFSEDLCNVIGTWVNGTADVTLTNPYDAGIGHNVLLATIGAGFTSNNNICYKTSLTNVSLAKLVSLRFVMKVSTNVGNEVLWINIKNAAGTILEHLNIGIIGDTNWHSYTIALANPTTDVDLTEFDIFITDATLTGGTLYIANIEYIATTASIVLASIPVSANPRVTSRKIYRTIKGGSVFYFLTEIANNTATTYTDNTLDADLGDANPPINGSTAPTHIKDLVLLQERLFAISTLSGATSTVFASNQEEPDIFPAAPNPDNSKIGQPFEVGQDDGDELMRIFGMEDWLYCFKKNYIYKEYIKGNPSLSWECRLIHNVGCSSYFGIAKGENDFYFYHTTGIYHIVDYSIEKISEPIRDYIKNIPTAMTGNPAMCLDRTRKKLLFAFCDPYISPTTINNSVAVYDLVTKEWEGVDNDLYVKSFLEKNDGTILYADYVDGFVKKLNQYEDDANQEKIIANIDNETWAGGANDTTNYKDGLKGLAITATAAASVTGATTFSTPIPLDTWTDGKPSSTADFIDFWLYHTTRANVASIKIEIDVNDDAYTDKYSYTVVVADLTSGDNAWTKIHIKKSTFTRAGSTSGKDWATVKGVKFTVTASASGTAVVTVDDIRIVADKRKLIITHYKTKAISPVSPEIDCHFLDLYLECKRFVDSYLGVKYEIDGQKKKWLDIFESGNVNVVITDYANARCVRRRKNDLAHHSEDKSMGAVKGIAINTDDIYVLVGNTEIRILRGATSNLLTLNSITAAEGICCDNDYLYVTDYTGNRVNIYATAGLFTQATPVVLVDTFGTTGSGNNNFDGPCGIACDGSNLYIVDKNNHRVKVHKKTSPYTFSAEYGEGNGTGTGNYNLKAPYGICIDYAHAWITDAGNNRIMKVLKNLDSDCFVAKIGTYGKMGDDCFDSPKGIVVDDNYIYIVDAGNNKLQKREKELLKFVEAVGSPTGLSGDGDDELNSPYDVAINDLDYYGENERRLMVIPIERIGKRISFEFIQDEIGQSMEIMGFNLSYKPMTLKGK